MSHTWIVCKICCSRRWQRRLSLQSNRSKFSVLFYSEQNTFDEKKKNSMVKNCCRKELEHEGEDKDHREYSTILTLRRYRFEVTITLSFTLLVLQLKSFFSTKRETLPFFSRFFPRVSSVECIEHFNCLCVSELLCKNALVLVNRFLYASRQRYSRVFLKPLEETHSTSPSSKKDSQT